MEPIKKGYIQFVPACSWCNEIIHDLINYEETPLQLSGGYNIVQHHITPPQCPHCGAFFQVIMMPTKLPFDETIFHNVEGEAEC